MKHILLFVALLSIVCVSQASTVHSNGFNGTYISVGGDLTFLEQHIQNACSFSTDPETCIKELTRLTWSLIYVGGSFYAQIQGSETSWEALGDVLRGLTYYTKSMYYGFVQKVGQFVAWLFNYAYDVWSHLSPETRKLWISHCEKLLQDNEINPNSALEFMCSFW